MVGRISFGVLVALLVFVPEGARAQVYPAYQEYPGANAWAPESPYQSYAPAPNEIAPAGYNPYPGNAYGAPGQGPAIMPAGAMSGPADGNAPGPFPAGPYQNSGPYPPYSPNIPENDISPWELAIHRARGTEFCDVMGDAINGSWFRMEYLLWTIDDPGSTLLGAPVLNVSNPHEFFDITSPTTGQARVSDLSQIGLRDNSGFRGTWGIPLMFGTFEIGGFVLEQGGDHFIAPELPSTGNTFIATSTHIDGAISDLLRAYDTSFEATYISEVWGADVNVVLDPKVPGEGLNHRPLTGFRFLSVRENLTQIGVSSDAPDWRTVIESDCSNNIYAVNFGLESALVHKWFTIGLRPQVALGLNSFRNRVATEEWVSATEGRVQDEISDTQFTAVGELTLFARIPVRENVNFHVGFTGLIISELERPDETIVYDTTSDGAGTPTASHFHAKHVDESLKVYGLTVGAEFIFR